MERRNNILQNIDWFTIILYLLLILGGWVNIYSAVFDESHTSIFDMSQRYGKQLIWIGLSLVLAFFLFVVDSKFFVTFGYFIYAFFILLLLLVLFIGKEVNGAKSWFVIGSFAFQPAEFAKYGTALALSKFVSSYEFNFKSLRQKLLLTTILLIPVSLIILQNDTGSALVYFIFLIPVFREGMSGLILFFGVLAAILFVMSLILNPITLMVCLIIAALIALIIIRKRWIEILWVLGTIVVSTIPFFIYFLIVKIPMNLAVVLQGASIVAAIGLIVYSIIRRIPQAPLIASIFLMSVMLTLSVDFAFNNILETHHQDRINNLLGIESDPLGAGYNVNQSKIAIGSGGFYGKGFLQGTQTKFDFVPEQSTDFIFCTVGEEWGFIGTTIVIALFLSLMLRIIFLAERQRSVFSRVYGYSVASILLFHVTINIGMTIGLAPVIGIPLPFFSYGGSSLWFFTILLFTFIRLDASRLEQLH